MNNPTLKLSKTWPPVSTDHFKYLLHDALYNPHYTASSTSTSIRYLESDDHLHKHHFCKMTTSTQIHTVRWPPPYSTPSFTFMLTSASHHHHVAQPHHHNFSTGSMIWRYCIWTKQCTVIHYPWNFFFKSN